MGVGFLKCSGCCWDLCTSLVPPLPCSSKGAKFPLVNKPANGSFLYILFFPPFFSHPCQNKQPIWAGLGGDFCSFHGDLALELLGAGFWGLVLFFFFPQIPVTGAW